MRKGNLKSAVLGLLAGVTLASAALAATAALRFTVNGKAVAGAISVDGKVYVPLSVLQANGLKITASAGGVQWTTAQAAGGANQLAAVQGCLGQTLFNGVWRMTVRSVSPATVAGASGYNVVVEMANGTPTLQSVYSTGLDVHKETYLLVTPDGDTGAWRSDADGSRFADRSVPPGGKFTFNFPYYPADTNAAAPAAPAKFIMPIDTKYVDKKSVPYSVADPSFRVDLTCRK